MIRTCLLISLTLTAIGARVQPKKALSDTSAKDHKCTITWTNKRNPSEVQTAKVAFGVGNCRIECLNTFADNSYDNAFPKSFTPVQDGPHCLCMETGEEKKNILKFVGTCDAGAAKKCWDDYKVLSTNTLSKQWDKDTLLITHNHKLYDQSTFSYANPVCEEGGCAGKKPCFESQLPDLMAGRTAEEKKLIGDLMQKIQNGGVDKNTLPADVQNLLNGLSEEDEANALFASLVPEDQHGQFTVGALKNMYEDKLKHTLISVDHMLRVAGYDPVDGLDDVVTPAGFKKFLEPDCE